MIEKLSLEKVRAKKVLAVGAHPDDVEFAAGGTVALLAQSSEVTFLIATDGGAGTHDGGEGAESVAEKRREEARTAGEILGAKRVVFFNYPDLELRDWRKHFFKKFMRFLLKNRPDILVTWDFWGRYEPLVHPDHRQVAEVVMEAVLEATLPQRVKKWTGSGSSPLDPKPRMWLMAPAEPEYIVDVSAVWETKWRALAAHRSQLAEGGGERFLGLKKRLEDKWFRPAGALIGAEFGEPFRIMAW